MTLIARIVVAFAAGWAVAGVAIGLFLKGFPRSAMDALAVVAVLLGLGAAAVCWRATRKWGPRKATPEELISGLDVHLGWPFITFVTLIGLVSFGMLALPFWLISRRWPKRVDPEGITLRNGTRLAWRDITENISGSKRLGGVPVNEWWELRGPNVRVSIVPNSLAEGQAVLEFTSRMLGRDLRTN